MNAPACPLPVWSRGVINDAIVTDWVFFGWFSSLGELSRAAGGEVSPCGFDGATYEFNGFQFAFVQRWKEAMIGCCFSAYDLPAERIFDKIEDEG